MGSRCRMPGGVMGGVRRLAGLRGGRRTKWLVLGFWVAVFAVAGPLAGKLNSAQQNDASAWLPSNAESTQVVNLAERFTPSDVFPALVVYERADGAVTAADQAKVAADAKRFAGVRDVSGEVLGPIPSEDGRALQVVVPIRVAEEGNGWEELTPIVEELRSIAKADAGGLSAYVTGPGEYFADFANVFSGFDSTLLYITAAIVMVILLLTYRSPVLWLLPLTCVFVALTAAQAVIYLLARDGGLTVNGQSAFILTVLVFGAGTDYALLLTARYRAELRPHGPPAPGRLGGHRRRAGVAGIGRDRPGGQRAAGQGLLPHRARVGQGRGGAGPPLCGRRRQPGPSHRQGRGRGAAAGGRVRHAGGDGRHPPGGQGRLRLRRGDPDQRRGQPSRLRHGRPAALHRARDPGGGRQGRRRQRRQPRHPACLPARPEPGGAAGPGSGADHPRPAAAGDRRAATAGRHGGAVVRGGAGRQRRGLQLRLRLRGSRPVVPAVDVCVPGRAGHRLQHLPDDQGARGDRPPRPPAGRADRPGRHRRGDHLRGGGAGGDVRRAGHAAAGVRHRDRLRGGVRRAAGHLRGPLGAGHRAEPRRRPLDLVAEQPVPQARRRPRRAPGGDGGRSPLITGTASCRRDRRRRASLGPILSGRREPVLSEAPA